MPTEKRDKLIISMMLMEMFLDGDDRGSKLIEAAHSYAQSSLMDGVPVADSALNIYAEIKTASVIEDMKNDH